MRGPTGAAVIGNAALSSAGGAVRQGGAWVAFATAAGFLLSFLIAEVL